MPYDLSSVLVVGISSRALFDLEEENALFERDGVNAFINYQLAHVEDAPKPGTGFRLIQNLMSLNQEGQPRRVEVIILSRNNAITSLRITKAIEHYGLDIARSAWTGGASQANYLGAYKVDLFLSAHEEDVQAAINAGFAAARIYGPPKLADNRTCKAIRIAFDGDAVLFSAESERIYQERGLEAFVQHERENATKPLPDGPFAPLLRTIAKIQAGYGLTEAPIRTALITASNSSAYERAIRTLQRFFGHVNIRDLWNPKSAKFGPQKWPPEEQGHVDSGEFNNQRAAVCSALKTGTRKRMSKAKFINQQIGKKAMSSSYQLSYSSSDRKDHHRVQKSDVG